MFHEYWEHDKKKLIYIKRFRSKLDQCTEGTDRSHMYGISHWGRSTEREPNKLCRWFSLQVGEKHPPMVNITVIFIPIVSLAHDESHSSLMVRDNIKSNVFSQDMGDAMPCQSCCAAISFLHWNLEVCLMGNWSPSYLRLQLPLSAMIFWFQIFGFIFYLYEKLLSAMHLSLMLLRKNSGWNV